MYRIASEEIFHRKDLGTLEKTWLGQLCGNMALCSKHWTTMDLAKSCPIWMSLVFGLVEQVSSSRLTQLSQRLTTQSQVKSMTSSNSVFFLGHTQLGLITLVNILLDYTYKYRFCLHWNQHFLWPLTIYLTSNNAL
jgi:hypothetical protein